MKHDMEELKTRFGMYLDAMFNKFNFGEAYCRAGDAESIYCDWEESYEAEDHYGIWFSNGCTRFVVGDENRDYVIKFQILDDKTDYGAFEANTYANAVAAGLADRFAWSAKLMDYSFNMGSHTYTFSVYVMECVDCDYYSVSERSYDYHYNIFCSENNLNPQDEESERLFNRKGECYAATKAMLEFAFNSWGVSAEYADKFTNFIEAEKINDLHCGNWGYRDGVLVLTDYAGFGSLSHRIYSGE